MKNKIISIFVMMLLLLTVLTTVNSKSYFDDSFELDAYSGGFQPNNSLFRIQINTNGEATYSIMYPEYRDTWMWTIITQFDLSENEKNQIWNEIILNDFFNLNSIYRSEHKIRDGTFAEMTINGEGKSNTVRTENTAVFPFDTIIKTINSITPGDQDLFYNAIFNHQPDQPSRPMGSSDGEVGIEYTYTSTANDYNNDKLYYLFNWGDGTNSGWVGPFDAGSLGSAKHKWTTQDSYNITVKAKDDPNADGDLSDGKESIWSLPLTVTMPKSKSVESILQRVFERLLERFQILRVFQYISGMYSTNSWFMTPTDEEYAMITQSDPNEQLLPTFEILDSSCDYNEKLLIENYMTESPGTRVVRKNCSITVNIYIQIRGPCATVQVTKDIEKNIEDVWNGNWKVKCEEDCDPRVPGCTVTFDAHVVRMPDGEYLPGFHDITIKCDNSSNGNGHVSNVTVWESDPEPPPPPADRVLDGPRPNDQTHPTTTGNWDTNEPANTYAHEAGHLMGLDDTYFPYKDPSYNNHIMSDNGAVRQEDIDLIIGMSGVKCPCECCPEEEDDEEPENDIMQPQNNSEVSSPIIVIGEADDGVSGSGIVELDYILEWDGGSYDGTPYLIDPPEKYVQYYLGPIYLENYIEPESWITITTYATDAAGNTGEDYITVTWVESTEDTTPPITEKTIGEPQWEGGYTIASFTPIWLNAIDPEPGSGVNHIHYEVWQYGIMKGSEDVPGDFVEMSFGMFGVVEGIAEIHYYAVDNENNIEATHVQEHFILY